MVFGSLTNISLCFFCSNSSLSRSPNKRLIPNLTRSQPLQRRMRIRRCERGRGWRRGRQSQSSQSANDPPRLEFWISASLLTRYLDFCYTFYGFLWKNQLTYYSDNLILRRIRLLLQFLFLIHSDMYNTHIDWKCCKAINWKSLPKKCQALSNSEPHACSLMRASPWLKGVSLTSGALYVAVWGQFVFVLFHSSRSCSVTVVHSNTISLFAVWILHTCPSVRYC